MAELLRLRVWSPAETLVDVQDVLWVHVALSQTRPLTIWPGHAPLLAETTGEGLRYADQAGTHVLELAPGMLQVSGNEVLILVGSGELQGTSEDGDERLERLTNALLAAAGSVP